MATAYSDALEDAIRLPGHSEAVDRIKQAVINELRATDDQMRIKKTDYFNHSFVPDLVLHWPQEDERRVIFLRPDPDPRYIQEDIDTSEDQNSIFYCLSQLSADRSTTTLDLHRSAQTAQTLVTDPSGISELVTQKRRNPVARLASGAVLQGARGVLGKDRAVSVTGAVTRGIEAASQTNAAATGKAVTTIEDAFDSIRALRINRLLQAVWVGSGGSASSFPGNLDFSGGLDEESLSYLLSLDTIDDFYFWRRIGRNLTLEKIANLRLNGNSGNFQQLVNANVDVLEAKTCRVVGAQPMLAATPSAASDRKFFWSLERGNLVLRNNFVAAYVAELADRLEAPEVEETGITFTKLEERTSLESIKVAELTLSAAGRNVSYSADAAIDISRDKQLTAVSRALGRDTVVERAVTHIPGRSPLTCDFLTHTTSGKTRATYPILELIRLSLGLLSGLLSEEREQIRQMESDTRDKPTLFD